jgi:hypothetical protein
MSGESGSYKCASSERFGSESPTAGAFSGVVMQWLPAVCAALLLFRAAAQAQDEATDVLRRVRRTVMGTVEGLPKYVCTQTIDRARYEPDGRYVSDSGTHRMHSCDSLAAKVTSAAWKRQLSSLDRPRLDVAVTHNRLGLDTEMYSWAGEEHFSDQDLFEMVRDGAVSTGSFSSMLASIFGGEAATFSYKGDVTFGGRLLSGFGFRVPLEEGHYCYVLGSGDRGNLTLDYEGTFLRSRVWLSAHMSCCGIGSNLRTSPDCGCRHRRFLRGRPERCRREARLHARLPAPGRPQGNRDRDSS